MERLVGSVEEIKFRNDENGWTALVLDSDGDPVTVCGTLPPVTPGDCLELDGEFIIHPRFGAQFKATRASVAQPHTVDKFGDKAIEIIEREPDKLAQVKGISVAKARKISEQFDALRNQREAIMFLTGYGISVNLALKLYNVYGAATVATVKTNPYILIEDVGGVGFLTADKIAQSMGIAALSEFRMRAGLLHALKTSCDKEGNTYLTRERLFDDAKKLL